MGFTTPSTPQSSPLQSPSSTTPQLNRSLSSIGSQPAYPSSPHSSVAELRAVITLRARSFRDMFATFDTTEADVDTPALHRLRGIADRLSASAATADSDVALSDLAKLLSQVDSVSTYEFISSGITDALTKYVSRPGLVEASRIERFARWAVDHNIVIPLVKHLHAAVSQLEDFVTILHDVSQQGSGMRSLTKPFRLRLQRGMIVFVHLLA